MHVYHYAPYEPAAFRRLMGRHATREAEIDRMLRAELFVDLHAVVKHSLRASVEKYSIKDLEPFYGFERAVDLKDARTNLRVVERALELEPFKPPSPRPSPGGRNPEEGRGWTLSRPRCGRRSRATTATTVSRLARFESGSSICVPKSNGMARRYRAHSRRMARPRKRSTSGLGVCRR